MIYATGDLAGSGPWTTNTDPGGASPLTSPQGAYNSGTGFPLASPQQDWASTNTPNFNPHAPWHISFEVTWTPVTDDQSIYIIFGSVNSTTALLLQVQLHTATGANSNFFITPPDPAPQLSQTFSVTLTTGPFPVSIDYDGTTITLTILGITVPIATGPLSGITPRTLTFGLDAQYGIALHVTNLHITNT